MTLICIICGRSENEVDSLFYFPGNKERVRVWQERLGMVYRGKMSSHQRVCNLHFDKDSFEPAIYPPRLRRNALPKISPDIAVIEGDVESSLPSTSSEVINAPQPQGVVTCLETPKEVPSTPLEMLCSPSFLTESYHEIPSEAPSTPVTSRPRMIRRSLFREVREICGPDASPRKKALIGIIKKKATHIRKLKRQCKGKGMTLKHIAAMDTPAEASNIFKGLSSTVAQFLVSQIRCAKRSPYGRRWTLDDKIVALAIYKRSAKCYALLRRLLALPSIRTLTLLLEKIPLKVGINDHIFSHLGKCLAEYNSVDRLCLLAFDEVALREHVQYNSSSDCIEGVEDFGNGRRTDKMANYALVFYIQGIIKKWKQPLAFYFSRGGASSVQIRSVLEEVLNALNRVNINIFCIVCDMGTANVKALKDMGSSISNPFIIHNGNKIFTLFDIPHLLKCLRNLFRKYNILVPVTIAGSSEMIQARWSDICEAYELDKRAPLIFRMLVKVKDYYLAPLRQNSMKVKVAAQTMSRIMSLCLFQLVERGILPSRALATATFVNEVDQLFDSCNGSSLEPPDGKPYKCHVTENSGHVEFWKESYEKVSRWRFIRKPEDATVACPWKPPSQNGWLHNLQALPQIWKALKDVGVRSLRTRSLNQDGLENLFGAIRSGLGCNENPTVPQFISSLKTQIINGLTNQSLQGTNCEDDDCTLLTTLRSFLECEDSPLSTKENSVPFTRLSSAHADDIVKDITDSVKEGNIQSLSVAYVAGFLLKKIYKNFTCDNCSKDLSSNNCDPCNYFISLKEFSETNSKLFYPSENLVVAVGHAVTILEDMLMSLRSEIGIQKTAEEFIKEHVNFSWLNSCELHSDFIKNCIIKGVCKVGIPWYCTRTVRDLKSAAYEEASRRKLKKLKHQ